MHQLQLVCAMQSHCCAVPQCRHVAGAWRGRRVGGHGCALMKLMRSLQAEHIRLEPLVETYPLSSYSFRGHLDWPRLLGQAFISTTTISSAAAKQTGGRHRISGWDRILILEQLAWNLSIGQGATAWRL